MLALRIWSQLPSTEWPPRWITLCAPLRPPRPRRPGEIGLHERLARLKVPGLYSVAQHQPTIELGQQRPRHGADATGGAGENDAARRVARDFFSVMAWILCKLAVALERACEMVVHGAAGLDRIASGNARHDEAVLVLDALSR